MPPLAVELRNITKRFTRVTANNNASLGVIKGEIHALIGENGAGKTTLMKLLYGMYRPDSGKIFVNGRRVKIGSTADAIKLSIGMLHQRPMLIDDFTVAENIILGREPRSGIRLDMKTARSDINKLSARHKLRVDPDVKVSRLSPGMVRSVELLKILYRSVNTIIMDEPASILTPSEKERFFGIMRSLRNDGCTIILITRKLKEVFSAADRVTVMRRGRVAGVRSVNKTNQIELTGMMGGGPVLMDLEKKEAHPGSCMLSLQGIVYEDPAGALILEGFDLDVMAGEITGLAGIRGSGRRELVQIISGLEKPRAGRIVFRDKDITSCSVKKRAQLGMSVIPDDQSRYACAAKLPVYMNMLLGRQYEKRLFGAAGIRRKETGRYCRELVRDHNIEPADCRIAMSALSAGNRQKVIAARELSKKPQMIIVSEPSRSLDVSAAEKLYKELISMRDGGAAVLIVSSDITELLAFCDKVAVMHAGSIADVIDASRADEKTVGMLMAGGSSR